MWSLFNLFVRPKTITETKTEYKLYKSLGEIKSQQACHYVLNHLVKALEEQKETYARRIIKINLNDRNASTDIGILRGIQATLGEIRFLLREYYKPEKEKEEV